MNLKEKHIELNDEEIFYLDNESKSEKNILFIHGNMYSSSCFIEIIKKLEDYHIFAPDMRGYGKSSYNNKITSIDDFVSDIKEFILKLDIKNFTLVSWSLGGADILTNNFHEYLNNFDFINPQKNLEIFKGLMAFNMNLIEDSFASMGMTGTELKKDNIRVLFKTFIYNVKLPEKEEFERNVESAIRQRNLDEVAGILRDYKYHGGSLAMKSLVLHGYDDKIISYMDGKFLADEIGAKFEKLDNCGHSVMTDEKNLVIKNIKKFVEE